MTATNTTLERPDVRAFCDGRAYLTAYYDWRKSREPDFSYASWATELEIKSRSYLRLLLVGKRTITDRLIPTFVLGLRFSKSEARYFTALVRIQNARSVHQRDLLFDELRQLSKVVPSLTRITDARQFLASTLVPRVQVLLTNGDLEATIPNLARILGRKTTEVREAVELLERMKLAERLECAGGVRWKAVVETFDVPDRADPSSLQSYHRQCLEEATLALKLPMEQRKFDSLILSLTEADYGQLVGEIRLCVDRFLSQFAGNTHGSARLYQMNMNLIPVSEPFLHRYQISDAPEGLTRAQTTGPTSIPQGANP